MILDFDSPAWTWSCVGHKSLKLKVIAEVNQKLRIQELEIKVKLEKKYLHLDLLWNNFKIIHISQQKSFGRPIWYQNNFPIHHVFDNGEHFIDFSDLKTVELVDDLFVSICSKLKNPNGFLPLFWKILTILFFALKRSFLKIG